ncbi:MAG TPA: hypothetical protein PLV25_00595, partial [Opitutales bacterium]|nr:hypothetical protein [Opitutales bacterium]
NTLLLLKALQHTATDKKLMEALVEAHEKYPRSPEVAIDLAHGYARIGNNPRNARILYGEFLDLAPLDHPRRAEAQDALEAI